MVVTLCVVASLKAGPSRLNACGVERAYELVGGCKAGFVGRAICCNLIPDVPLGVLCTQNWAVRMAR